MSMCTHQYFVLLPNRDLGYVSSIKLIRYHFESLLPHISQRLSSCFHSTVRLFAWVRLRFALCLIYFSHQTQSWKQTTPWRWRNKSAWNLERHLEHQTSRVSTAFHGFAHRMSRRLHGYYTHQVTLRISWVCLVLRWPKDFRFLWVLNPMNSICSAEKRMTSASVASFQEHLRSHGPMFCPETLTSRMQETCK